MLKALSILFCLTLLILPGKYTNAQDGSGAQLPVSVSLAGEWHFKLDPQSMGLSEEWFKKTLHDLIRLPGTCEEQGYGEKNIKPATGRLTKMIRYEGCAWYQREIVIPENWDGKRTELYLERCMWESSVWLDDQRIGTENSLSTPHIFDLGILSPGIHRLTIRIDNTYKLPIGTWAHAVTEDTQGRWNGIIGRIELRATDPVWIRNIQVYPDQIMVTVGNQTGLSKDAIIQSVKCTIPAGGGTVVIPFAEKEQTWDEFSPVMLSLKVTLTSGRFSDQRTVSYAIRKIGTQNRQFTLNGKPVLFRGPVDECIYPLTGYPPMDKASWIHVLNICKSYGFNFMRFHSWCPPEAAFEAGDELGFCFQIELPLWTMDAPHFGQDPERDQFIRNELNRILDSYGNHPSFALMAMGNESAGTLDELTQIGRAKDSRHIYRCEKGNTTETGDYFEIGQRGIAGPRTDWDRWTSTAGWIVNADSMAAEDMPQVPVLAHEVGQWNMYPDLDEVKKYTGIFRAFNFDGYRQSLETHHMSDQAGSFRQASGALSMVLYKDEIEGSMRTWPYGGFQVLEARDYPGQGSAIVGWLDAFWDSKGLITPAEFRRFCGPTVCLLRMSKRVYTADESFVGQAEIAHYGPVDLQVNPVWSIKDLQGKTVASGKFSPATVRTGLITRLGEISASLSKVNVPSRYIVTLGAGEFSNSWDIWVYPAKVPDQIPNNIRIAYAFDKETKDALENGETVLLFSSPKEGLIQFHKGMLMPDSLRALPGAQPGQNAVPGSFMPVFWDIRLFNQIGTLGILCDPNHPAFKYFPTEFHSNWQWADLLGHFTAANSFRVAGAPEQMALDLEKGAGDVEYRSKAIILDETPADFRPILQVIDNYDRNVKLGTIFEARVGIGKLLVCAMDLDTDLANRPAARQLRYSLMEYAAGNEFNPVHTLSFELLDRLLQP
jgi:hypothetical protein